MWAGIDWIDEKVYYSEENKNWWKFENISHLKIVACLSAIVLPFIAPT